MEAHSPNPHDHLGLAQGIAGTAPHPFLVQSQNSTSPLSSSSSSFTSLTGYDEDPLCPDARRKSEGSMTSWGTGSRNGSLDMDKAADSPITTHIASLDFQQTCDFAPTFGSPVIDLSSPPRPYLSLEGTSPTYSTHSSAQSRGESTPRAEISAPVWPLSMSSYTNPVGRSPYGMDGLVDKDEIRRLGESLETTLRGRKEVKAKHTSLDNRPVFTQAKAYNPKSSSDTPAESNTGVTTPLRDNSASIQCTPPVGQRILASSTLTGCQITAPLSPPAHYPSTSARRASHSCSRSSKSTSASSSSLHSLGSMDCQSPVPQWAKPPGKRERSGLFSSAGNQPPMVDDEDDEVVEGGRGDGNGDYIEVIKGSEGRIAVRAETECYQIMCWLPGFSLENITISAKGRQSVQIVADLWDEEDHAEWNVGLGTDADMKAISAQFNDGELRLKVARKVKPSNPYWANRLRCTSVDEMSTPREDTPIGTMARIGCRNPLPMARSRTCDQV